MQSDVLRRIVELRALIAKANHDYYDLDMPTVGDADYDLWERELLRLEADNPQFAASSSPVNQVAGGVLAGFAKVPHNPPMQSLDKTHSFPELRAFDAFVSHAIANFTYLVEPKIDGVSLSLHYSHGRLVQAATRGNGQIGDDITANVLTIPTLPSTLPPTAPQELEVRGEAYMTREGFVALNQREAALGHEEFANPRNACSGSLKQLDPTITASRPLDVVIYNAGGVGCEGFARHSEMIAAFAQWGFPVAPWSKACRTIDEVFAAIDELGALRHSFRFEIDGAVVKIDERRFYAELGATAHGPRWARAYKYAPERVATKVMGITVQVGRTGILTPVAELSPTEIAGSIVSRATLHNADQIARQDIRVGDHVWLVKAGDVIPAIDSVIFEKRDGSERVFTMPDRCPICGGAVKRMEGEVALRCINPECTAQLVRRIEHFASRDALDITALGEIVVEALVDQHKVKDPLDLFSLTIENLAALEISGHRLGKNAEKVVKALADAKSLPLHRWLFAIGIPTIGVTTARKIARGELSPSAEIQLKIDSWLSRLAALGIMPTEPKTEVRAEGPLVGMGCVLTGALSRPRDEYAALIVAAGGIVQSAVSKKTRYLIAGENIGATKMGKARQLGVEIIDEAKLLELLTIH